VTRGARRRRTYPTGYSVGPLRLVVFRHRRGYVIVDEAGAVAWTTPHPITGRPMPVLEPDARRALRMAREILLAERP